LSLPVASVDSDERTSGGRSVAGSRLKTASGNARAAARRHSGGSACAQTPNERQAVDEELSDEVIQFVLQADRVHAFEVALKGLTVALASPDPQLGGADDSADDAGVTRKFMSSGNPSSLSLAAASRAC
jgi:hypothetical protein